MEYTPLLVLLTIFALIIFAIYVVNQMLNIPDCYMSNPNEAEQVELDCDNCHERDGCLK